MHDVMSQDDTIVQDNLKEDAITSADRAYHLIEARIVRLQYPPGFLLSEQQLSLELGISRTPVREALRRLTVDKMTEILPRKGAFVTTIEVKEYLHLLDLRKQLECFAAMRAAKRSTDEQRMRMRMLSKELRDGMRAPNQEIFVYADKEYKDLIIEGSKNPFIGTMISPMHAHSRRFWYFYKKYWRENEPEDAIVLHLKVMDAVAAGDVEGSEAAVMELFVYLEGFAHRVLESEYMI